jgi:hypothetical protein
MQILGEIVPEPVHLPADLGVVAEQQAANEVEVVQNVVMEVEQLVLPDFLPPAAPTDLQGHLNLPDYLPARLPNGNNIPGRTFNLNLNVNMALVPAQISGQTDPGWAAFLDRKEKASMLKPIPDVHRLWAKHFSSVGFPELVVNIPVDWAAFFTAKLLSPKSFDWAKSFLASKAWQIMINLVGTIELMSFALPPKCPKNAEVRCVSPFLSQDNDSDFESFGKSEKVGQLEASNASVVSPVVETEARRSPRIRNRNGGFKHNSCPSKNCLACLAVPPSLSGSMMKSVGESYCKVKAGKLQVQELSVKKKGKQAIGGLKTKKGAEKGKSLEEADGQEPAKRGRK